MQIRLDLEIKDLFFQGEGKQAKDISDSVNGTCFGWKADESDSVQ